jgi:hypothetical protein
MGAGQSLIDRMDWDAFIAALPANSNAYESAVGGKPMSKTVGDQTADEAWVDDITSAPTFIDDYYLTQYIAEVDTRYDNRTDVNVVIHQNVISSRNFVTVEGGAGFLTKAEWKARLIWLWGRFRELHGASTPIIAGLPHRYTGATTAEDIGLQLMREAIIEASEADGNVYLVEHCDIDLADATHHAVTAGEVEFGTRMGDMANYAINGGVAPDYPVLQSAVIDEYEITCTFSSNLTLPASGFGQIHVHDDYMTKTIASIALGASDNIMIITMIDALVDGVNSKVYIGYGANANLASTDADTLNNGAGSLPARGAVDAVSGTYPSDPIPALLTSGDEYWNAQDATKTYSAGVEIDNVSQFGNGFTEHTNGNNTPPVFEADHFRSGEGGIKFARNSDCLDRVDTDTMDGTRTFIYVVDLPNAPSGDIRLWQHGADDGSSTTRSSTYIGGGGVGSLRFAQDQGGGYPELVAGVGNGVFVIAQDFNSVDEMETYVNSFDILSTIDPNNDMAYAGIQIGARGGYTDACLATYGAFVVSDDGLSPADILIATKYLGSRYRTPMA